MKKQRVYLSTIDPEAGSIARAQGLGVEIAEYCTASNMDEHFEEHHQKVLAEVQGVSRRILHGPFNELFPCAIDPKARRLAVQRYRQAWGGKLWGRQGGYPCRVCAEYLLSLLVYGAIYPLLARILKGYAGK